MSGGGSGGDGGGGLSVTLLRRISATMPLRCRSVWTKRSPHAGSPAEEGGGSADGGGVGSASAPTGRIEAIRMRSKRGSRGG